jgi:hypothetical protein
MQHISKNTRKKTKKIKIKKENTQLLEKIGKIQKKIQNVPSSKNPHRFTV